MADKKAAASSADAQPFGWLVDMIRHVTGADQAEAAKPQAGTGSSGGSTTQKVEVADKPAQSAKSPENALAPTVNAAGPQQGDFMPLSNVVPGVPAVSTLTPIQFSGINPGALSQSIQNIAAQNSSNTGQTTSKDNEGVKNLMDFISGKGDGGGVGKAVSAGKDIISGIGSALASIL